MNIDAVLNAIANSSRFPIAERAKGETWIQYPLPVDPEFVAPPLSGDIPQGARIVLVSGPGAAGKSMVARWLATRSDVAYFNLAGRTVARDSARGFIGEAFSDSRYSDVVRALREGRYTLILDALDEARLASGEGPFEDFLRGLAEVVREHRGHASLVLFSRNETALWAQLVFEDAKLPGVARLELRPFAEREAAIDVIYQHCDRWHQLKARRGLPEWSREMSGELLDVAQEVAKGFGSEETQQAFWGYGALLASLGRLLAEEILNGARRGDLRDRFTRDSKLGPDLFIRVAEELLKREQTKFIYAAREYFGARARGFSSWNSLYSKDEQCRRLVSYITHVSLPQPPPRELPDSLRDGYERLVSQTLPEHPFVGLSPYEEYLRAHFLVHETDENRRREFLRVLDEKPYLPTPILAWCLLAMPPRGRRLRAGNLGYLVESWIAHQELGASLRVIIEGAGNNIVVQADGASWIPEIRLTDVQGGLWFWRHLERATVDVDCNVHLGTSERDFVLGPDVSLTCGRLSCVSPSLSVNTGRNGDDGEGVALRADDIDGSPRVTIYGAQVSFLIYADDLKFPWVQWQKKVPSFRPSDDQIREAFADLRRLLAWFRSHGYEGLGRHVELIDNRAVGDNAARRKLLDYCIKRELIFRDGAMYKLNPDVIDELGINVAHLHHGVFTERLETFLCEFVGK